MTKVTSINCKLNMGVAESEGYMPFIQWENRLATGVELFDEHHRHLVGLLNKTYDDFIFGAPDEQIIQIIEELICYAGYHFAAEETWMREHRYPKLHEHSREHEMFTKKIHEFRSDLDNGNVEISLDVLTFLKRWLKHHILESDADYGHFLRSISL